MDDKKMQGALFLNDKDGNESRPDFRGKITLDDGRILKVSAWKSVSQAGNPYLSCKCDYDDAADTKATDNAWAAVAFGDKKPETAQPMPETAVAVGDDVPF